MPSSCLQSRSSGCSPSIVLPPDAIRRCHPAGLVSRHLRAQHFIEYVGLFGLGLRLLHVSVSYRRRVGSFTASFELRRSPYAAYSTPRYHMSAHYAFHVRPHPSSLNRLPSCSSARLLPCACRSRRTRSTLFISSSCTRTWATPGSSDVR